MHWIYLIFAFFFALRLATLAFSIRNEKRLLQLGAVQYGRRNSLHHTSLDGIAILGASIMGFAYAMLFYVIYRLRDVWTVKVYIVPHQRIETSFLFRTVRHPNYILNILPELVGVAMLCHAWCTLALGLPVYCVILAVRIVQEERAMRDLW